MADKVADKVKEVAQEEFERVSTLVTDAAQSGAYLYPFRGILYFLTHKELWRPLQSKLVSTVTLALGLTTFMFVFTYVPQVFVMAFFEGPLAPFSTVLLVLNESSFIFNAVSKTFLIDEVLVETFDGTLVARDFTPLVSEGRQIRSGSKDAVGKLGKLLKKPFAAYSPKAIIRYFMYLPLNFIPVVGTIIFILLQGRKTGTAAHLRYFQLKKYTTQQREAWLEQNKAQYTSFGVPAQLLEMIPLVGIVFSFTNQVGAALWAADIESRASVYEGKGLEGSKSGSGSGKAKKIA